MTSPLEDINGDAGLPNAWGCYLVLLTGIQQELNMANAINLARLEMEQPFRPPA